MFVLFLGRSRFFTIFLRYIIFLLLLVDLILHVEGPLQADSGIILQRKPDDTELFDEDESPTPIEDDQKIEL